MVHPLRDKAAVSGIGETAYTRGTSKSALALQLEASLKALDDAGIDPRDVDGVIPYFPGGAIAEDFIANLGLRDLALSAFIPMGGATCTAARDQPSIIWRCRSMASGSRCQSLASRSTA